MRKIEDILASHRVMLLSKAHDGFNGFITIRGWEGSVVALGAGDE